MSRQRRPATEPTTCSSCGASVLWAQWASSGKKMPVDATPDHEGRLVLHHRMPADLLLIDQFRPEAHAGRRRWTSHFSTCPSASQHPSR